MHRFLFYLFFFYSSWAITTNNHTCTHIGMKNNTRMMDWKGEDMWFFFIFFFVEEWMSEFVFLMVKIECIDLKEIHEVDDYIKRCGYLVRYFSGWDDTGFGLVEEWHIKIKICKVESIRTWEHLSWLWAWWGLVWAPDFFFRMETIWCTIYGKKKNSGRMF